MTLVLTLNSQFHITVHCSIILTFSLSLHTFNHLLLFAIYIWCMGNNTLYFNISKSIKSFFSCRFLCIIFKFVCILKYHKFFFSCRFLCIVFKFVCILFRRGTQNDTCKINHLILKLANWEVWNLQENEWIAYWCDTWSHLYRDDK